MPRANRLNVELVKKVTRMGFRSRFRLDTLAENVKPLAMYLVGIFACLLSIVWKPEIGLYYIIPLLPMQTARFWVHQFPLGEKLVDFVLLCVSSSALCCVRNALSLLHRR